MILTQAPLTSFFPVLYTVSHGLQQFLYIFNCLLSCDQSSILRLSNDIWAFWPAFADKEHGMRLKVFAKNDKWTFSCDYLIKLCSTLFSPLWTIKSRMAADQQWYLCLASFSLNQLSSLCRLEPPPWTSSSVRSSISSPTRRELSHRTSCSSRSAPSLGAATVLFCFISLKKINKSKLNTAVWQFRGFVTPKTTLEGRCVNQWELRQYWCLTHSYWETLAFLRGIHPLRFVK